MAEKDREKWDKKYQDKPELLDVRPPSKFVEKYYKMCEANQALDLASGGGRHTLYLSEKGFLVDAVDISPIALEKLSSKIDNKMVNLIESDLDTFTPKQNHYDFIVMTNFLDRDLIVRCYEALKDGGIFVVETYMEDDENEKKDSNPQFLLKEDELILMFYNGFKRLDYAEFWNEDYEKYRMKKQAIAVQKGRQMQIKYGQ
jgi:SAM-dependent methyltransferase